MPGLHSDNSQNAKPLSYQRESTMADRHGAVEVSVRDGYVSVRLPEVCSWCLIPTQECWTLETANGKLVLPICPDCRRLWKIRRRILGMGCLLSVITSVVAFFAVVSLGGSQGLRRGDGILNCFVDDHAVHYLPAFCFADWELAWAVLQECSTQVPQ